MWWLSWPLLASNKICRKLYTHIKSNTHRRKCDKKTRSSSNQSYKGYIDATVHTIHTQCALHTYNIASYIHYRLTCKSYAINSCTIVFHPSFIANEKKTSWFSFVFPSLIILHLYDFQFSFCVSHFMWICGSEIPITR